jgi:ABC-type sugar transport system ATPase subunit
MSQLVVQSLSVTLGESQILNDVGFTLAKGSCAVLVGASGCGKTTLLRAIAGLQARDEGTITWNENLVLQPNMQLIPGHPAIKLITQDFELLPMLSGYEHIYQSAAPWGEEEKDKTAKRLLRVFGLQKVAHKPVRTLSGGQQQRVALAKNLATNANLFLFDEAFSQLDLATRADVMRKVKTYLKQHSKTALFVVHDPLDAFYLADTMFVLHNGRIAQKGLPRDVFTKPKSMAIAKLFGMVNKLPKAFADDLFPKNAFYTLGQNAIFRPQQAQLKRIKMPFTIIDEVETPRGTIYQLKIATYKIWVEG